MKLFPRWPRALKRMVPFDAIAVYVRHAKTGCIPTLRQR